MKEIFCEKGVAAASSEISDLDMELINKYARRTLQKEEVYTFKLVLCDNEIDRDLEQFSNDALSELSKLFVGKTGIFDHSLKSRDQTARIFKTEIEKSENEQNSLGQQYVKLTAHAYMPRNEKNAPIIAEIDAGILKEVSVGCSVRFITCGICGKDVRSEGCTHLKGQEYSGRVCHHILSSPTDAYEWSFVAVPAQKNAGVSKNFNLQEEGGENVMKDILEVIKSQKEPLTLGSEQLHEIAKRFEKNEELAKIGEKYLCNLSEKVKKLKSIAMPEIEDRAFESILKKLDFEELSALDSAFEKKSAKLMPPVVQLAGDERVRSDFRDNEFKI